MVFATTDMWLNGVLVSQNVDKTLKAICSNIKNAQVVAEMLNADTLSYTIWF